MARPPRPAPALTPEHLALVESLELYIDDQIGSAGPGGGQVVVTLPVVPDADVAAELRRRYLVCGWSRVVVGEKHGEGVIQLESYVDVFLSRRPE
ncbi:MAG: hypothetical protein Q8P41_31520 [Pseudomonadota bacterium]|nr:hypothetical protein [Pseudomonadota bacterium]